MITINLFWKEELDWPDFLVKAGACPSWLSHLPFQRFFSPLPVCSVLGTRAANHTVLLGNKQCQ